MAFSHSVTEGRAKSLSLPFEGHPTNPFTIAPISQGIPSESTLCDDTPACIPILPNAECFGERQPLEAVAPFPWPDCYVSTFTARSCRVTNAKRDYSHVLCVPIDLVNARANRWIFKDRSFLNDFEERREQGDPEALARKARSLSPAESSADPLYFLPPLPSVSRPDAATTTGLDTPGAEAVIEDSSTAGNFSGTPAFNPAEFPPESALYGALASAMFNTGRPDQPIVNIWYDLDMVSGVRDPHLFASEYDMLEQCVSFLTCCVHWLI
ncbi:hypothetical protein PENSPDRAFT_372789 [Peniophora sp. CONT]|nr:hypothetical protein PENSPDRAFT_372789 [Peniophora sp. CONT]